MKEEEIGARLTLVCYSWTVYKIWVADVQCCFLSQTQSREPAIRPEFRLKMAAFRTTFLDIFDEDCRKQVFLFLALLSELSQLCLFIVSTIQLTVRS